MTNVLFSYCDIPNQAVRITPNLTVSDDHNQWNTICGHRYLRHRLVTPGQTQFFVMDLGVNIRQADHLIIARADCLWVEGVTGCTLAYSDDGVAWTNCFGTFTGFQTRTFVGSRREDLIFTPTFNDDVGVTTTSTPTKRFWRLHITSGGSVHNRIFSKFYCGMFFDMGQDPSDVKPEIIRPESQTFFSSGAKYLYRSDWPRYQYTFTWDGVTDEKAKEFQSIVKLQATRPGVFIYTKDHHEVLDEKRLLHCHLITDSFRVSPLRNKPNANRVTCTFLEQIG